MDEPADGNALPELLNPGPTLLSAGLLGGIGLFRVQPVAGAFILVVDVFIYYMIAVSGPIALILLLPWRIVALLYAMTAVVRHNRLILDYREKIKRERMAATRKREMENKG